MNKKIYAAVGVVALVVVAGVGYDLYSKKNASQPEETAMTQSQTENQTAQSSESSASTPKSMMELMASSSSMKCAYSDSGNQGEFYFSSGKARGDFSVSGGQKAHMIFADQTSYFWMDGAAQGFKSKIDSAQPTSGASGGTGSGQGVDPNKKLNYSCSPWSADASFFAAPSSVQFLDTGEMMKMPGN